MKINIICAGYCFNNGKPDQRAGCAVYLEFDDDYDRHADRLISEPVGNSTKPRAEILAATYGLMAIERKFRKVCPVTICVPRYVAGLLERGEDGEYKTNPKKNAEEVKQLREWASYFTRLKIVPSSVADLSRCLALARTCADKQKGTDTGTRVTS